MKNKLFFLIIVIIFSIYDYVQSQKLRFSQISTDNGLPSGSVISIIQDNRGFIWFGTEDGLAKYDGYNISVFRNDPNNINSISENYITSIVEDGDYLWVGTRNALNRYSKEKNNFKRYLYNSKDPNSISNNTVNTLINDNKGRIWIGTENGICTYVPAKNNFVRYYYNQTADANLNIRVRSITMGGNGTFWVGTMTWLYRFNPDSNIFKPYLFDNSKNTIKDFNFNLYATEDNKHNLWIGDFWGLYYVNMKTHKTYHYINNPKQPNSLCYDQVNHILQDNQGNVWVGTNKGLTYIKNGTEINGNQEIFHKIPYSLNNIFGIGSNIIMRTFQDDNSRIWICGRAGSLSIYDKYYFKFKYIDFVNMGKQFTSNNMNPIAEDKQGNIYFGTDGGGIYYWDRKKDTYKAYQNIYYDKNSLTSDKVLALCLDSDGFLWIGMWGGGVDRFDPRTKIFKHYRSNMKDKNTLTTDNVFYIFEDSRKNIWIGLWNGGLNIYDRKNDCFKRLPYGSNNPSSLLGYNVMKIYEDKEKNLWIGTEIDGLDLVNPNTLKFHHFNLDYDKNLTAHIGVNTIYEDSKDRLWIGTRIGLFLYNKATKSFSITPINNLLSSNCINSILEDNSGNLWFSTNHGISKLTIQSETGISRYLIKNYDKDDGLQGNQFNVWSSLKTSKGELIFGGINGINIFNPDSIKDNPYIPPVEITGFSISNIPEPYGKPGSPLTKDINETRKINLSYKQSNISFEFTALNYSHQDKNEYAYMLEGFDKDWQYVGNQRRATYTNLDPGMYTFRVKASNNDGIWNNKGASVTLIIKPPFWKTTWFRLLALVFIISSLVSLYLLRVASIRRKNYQLGQLVKERTREIEEKNKALSEQTEILSETNTLLVERQKKINEQATILQNTNALLKVRQQQIEEQSDSLNITNTLLEERQQQIEEQSEELKAQRDQLSQLNVTKDKLFSILAHDLRNPFHVIIGFSELLVSDFKRLSEDKIQRFLGLIHSSSIRGNDLLENILQWSRAQTGRITFDPEEQYLSEIADEVISLLEGSAQQKHITINQLVDPKVIVIADKNMLKTILRNLFSNAIKFTPEKGHITLKAEISINSAYVEVAVSDTGVGIPEATLKNLFRVDTTVTTKGTAQEAGTGLGLIICKEFVEKHKGKLWVQSQVNTGSTFYFTLPYSRDFF